MCILRMIHTVGVRSPCTAHSTFPCGFITLNFSVLGVLFKISYGAYLSNGEHPGIRHVGCNLNVHNGNTHVLAQGLKFFPQYLDKERTRALDAVAVEWKVLGTKQLAEGKKLKELPASSSDADKGRGTTDMTVANTEKLPNPSHRQMPPKTGDCICC